MQLPLILIGGLISPRGGFDALGLYLGDAITAGFAEQYPEPVIITGAGGSIIGSIGGGSAFKHLPHRGVIDNARRFGLDYPAGYYCPRCNARRVAICHKIPRSFGGNLEPFNLYIDCADCNSKQMNVLTPAQIVALAPYRVRVDLSISGLQRFVDSITGGDNE